MSTADSDTEVSAWDAVFSADLIHDKNITLATLRDRFVVVRPAPGRLALGYCAHGTHSA